MPKDSPEQATAELTEREQEILRLLATGTSNKEIAQSLFISSNTVKVHLRNIFAKIGAASRTEAAMYAVRLKLVQPAYEGETPVGIEPVPQPAPWYARFAGRRFTVAAVFLVLLLLILGTFWVARLRAGSSINNPAAVNASRWHSLAGLTAGRVNMAVSSVEDKIYAIGGQSAGAVTGETDCYDPVINAWTRLADKPVPVTDAKAVVLGGKIYVPGGRLGDGKVTKILEVFDPRLNQWTSGADLPDALSAYAMAAFEGRLYLFGGWDGTNILDTVYIYRPDAESWSEGTPMPTARQFAGAVVVGGKVYVVGGANSKGELPVNEIYDLSLGESSQSQWQSGSPMPASFSDIGLVNVVDLVYAVVSEEGSNGIYVYHSSETDKKKAWEFIAMPYEFGPGFSPVLVGTKLYILGTSPADNKSGLNVAYDAIYTIVLPVTK